MKDALPVVAAFDFDGTLTYRDSLLPFAIFSKGKVHCTVALTLALPSLLAFLMKLVPRQAAKEELLTRFFGGENVEAVKRWGEEFARQGVPFLLRREAMERFLWHKEQGHRCVVVSASVDAYLIPWAKAVGFNDVLGSHLAVAPDEKLTGKLDGLNCWGPEKVVRLEALLGPKSHYTLYAYGDSRGDQEMLDLADYAFKGKFK